MRFGSASAIADMGVPAVARDAGGAAPSSYV